MDLYSSTESAVGEISTNPFDDSSSDDDTFFYQECHEDVNEQQDQESLFSEVTNATGLGFQHIDGAEEQSLYTTKSEVTQRSEGGKRKAPLSFSVQAVDAKPALNFSNAQRTLVDFVSPLETALINRVDHLKSSSGVHESDVDSDEDEDDDETEDDDVKADVVKNDGYFSRLKGLSMYFVSPTRQLSKDNQKETIDTQEFDKELHSNDKSRAIDFSAAGMTPIAPNNSEDLKSGDDVESKLYSPLEEAKDVLSRMDELMGTPVAKKKPKRKRKSKRKEIEEDKNVLKKIESHPDHLTTDHRHGSSPWNRLIILEELGTASTWIVLLLPYVAFIFAFLLDSRASLWESGSGPLKTGNLCDTSSPEPLAFPATLRHNKPCFYRYELVEGQGLLSNSQRKVDDVSVEYKHTMTKGVAFTSGPIEVPVLSPFLYGDLTYSSLSSSSVSLVADGMVQFSTIVWQQKLDSTDGKWFPVSISIPRELSMLCEKEGDSSSSQADIRWQCKSPQNVDVLFELPENSVLTGGPVRVDTIISYALEALNMKKGIGMGRSKIISNRIEDTDILKASDRSRPEDILLELATSVSYQFTCSSHFRTLVLVVVRIGCLILSIIFTCFWFWSMGVNGFFMIGECFPCFYQQTPWSEEEATLNKKKQDVLWWECPWTLFPERRYLLVLLLSLFLLQNPVLSYMYFNPKLYSSTKMHVLADSVIGIGLHGVLFMWLCLFQGIRYHTASKARKRAQHQKEILELRKATKFLATYGSSQYNACASPSDHLASFFDEFGDLQGTTAINIRLKHDLCGDGCADFLLPKMLLFLAGACAVVVTSLFRFCADTSDMDAIFTIFSIDAHFFTDHRDLFIVSSLTQLAILALWATLIIRAALRTGDLLRKEPFLSTRPAQLAYRVLMSILVLGITSFLLPLASDVISLLDDWSVDQETWHRSAFGVSDEKLIYKSSSEYYVNKSDNSLVDLCKTIIIHAAQRFPYSGSASSLGPGETIYVTIATLVAAFIFLPSTSYILDDDNQIPVEGVHDGNGPKENQRRDKRAVLPMSKYTHTWRAFPLPIERHQNVNKVKTKIVESFQVDNNLKKIVKDDHGRGTIYKENYVPLFCVETALWLAECSWQTYYSTTEYKTDDFAPGIMNLDTLGLGLEADIYNEKSDTRAFVASNITSQIDGERDSIIVVAFRGTASSTNLKTDFNWGQEALPEHFISGADGQSQFQIDVNESDGDDIEIAGSTRTTHAQRENFLSKGLIHEADTILRSAPITRLAFPCVHSGFIQAYSMLRDEIMSKVVQVMERQINKALERCRHSTSKTEAEVPFVLPKIYVTGHSLGGSLAQLLALDISCNVELKLGNLHSKLHRPSGLHTRGVSDGTGLVESHSTSSTLKASLAGPFPPRPVLPARRHSLTSDETRLSVHSSDFIHGILSGTDFVGDENSIYLRPPIAVYTFGQPRVGNHSFSKFYKAHVPHTFRVVTEDDAITSLPLPTSCPPALYKHAGLEVILDEGNTGNILVGPTIAETLFRFSKVRTSMFAHLLDKYRTGLESTLTQDELEEFYRTHGVNSRSIRSGYNTSDVLPDWVTHITRRNF